ncbi:MAG: YidC/Oxa1 family membrane protein insertase [Solirubrobacteraceae bacterium]
MMMLTANIFQPLIDVFEAVLKFFHNSWGIPWGWAIVLLTVVIRALMLPLTVKQFHSMRQLQLHGPELKAIQQKYKADKQRQQQEVMKFYKENNVNPFGSCLPMVAQLPVFISLFYMLKQSLRPDICPQIQARYQLKYLLTHHVSRAVAMGQTTPCGAGHGANFLFISDLTAAATGATLIILLVLYVGTQLASSLVMQTPTMDKTQRMVMLGVPFIFVFIVIKFPAGVLVYWITTNTWTIGQQLIIKRRIGPVVPAAPAVAAVPAARARGSDGSSGGSSSSRQKALSVDGRNREKSDGGGLAKLLREKVRGETAAPKASSAGRARGATPPPSPRKKKKRSGRRR